MSLKIVLSPSTHANDDGLHVAGRAGGDRRRVVDMTSKLQTNAGELAVFFLGQAGSAFTAVSGRAVNIEAYLCKYNQKHSGALRQRAYNCPATLLGSRLISG